MSIGDERSRQSPPCGTQYHSNGNVTWRVWAPFAKQVELVFFDAAGRTTSVSMSQEPRGFFSTEQREIEEGQRYAYRLDGDSELPDPASRWQPDDVHRPSAVLFPERFPWTDEAWKGIPREDLVIYELHVGTFSDEGTFDAIIPRLPVLRELGITAIELMPLAQFPGARGWGYDGVHPFAVQNSYGGPHGLHRLIDACHHEGMALFLDVVYNHLGPEGNYLGLFGPYFSDRYHTPWGRAVNFDDQGSDPVREFVLDNVRYWIRDFHIDGLRLDAIHAIYDASARHILRDVKAAADEAAEQRGWPACIIAESNLNDVRLLDPTSHGGFGLDGQWSDDFHHCVHTLLTGERDGYYADFDNPPQQLAKALNDIFVYNGSFSRFRDRRHGAPAGEHSGDKFVISIQNHDQIGNRAQGDRFGTLLSPAQQRLAAGLLLLAPHVPLLFMGEEYGERAPFPFFCSFLDPQLIEAVRKGRREEFADFAWEGELPDPQAEETFQSAKLHWNWPERTLASGMRRLYGDLLKLRRSRPELRDFRQRSAELVDSEGNGLLRMTRGEMEKHNSGIVAFFNLQGTEVRLPEHGAALLIRSETLRYGAEWESADRATLAPYEFAVFAVKEGTPS